MENSGNGTSRKRERIPQSVRFNVFRRDEFTCRYCGRSSPDVVIHLDHIKPVADGGSDDETNLITACMDCNYGKSDRRGVSPPKRSRRVNAEQSNGEETLVGMYGHRLTGDGGDIKNQFKIIKRPALGRYVIQLFSFLSGDPTDCETVSEEELLSKSVKLYQTHEQWIYAYCKDSARRNERRGRDQWLTNPNNLYGRYYDDAGKFIG